MISSRSARLMALANRCAGGRDRRCRADITLAGQVGHSIEVSTSHIKPELTPTLGRLG